MFNNVLKSITLHWLLRCEVVLTQFESVEVSIILHSWFTELERIILEAVVLFYQLGVIGAWESAFDMFLRPTGSS